jgi:hypothetical protein
LAVDGKRSEKSGGTSCKTTTQKSSIRGGTQQREEVQMKAGLIRGETPGGETRGSVLESSTSLELDHSRITLRKNPQRMNE